MNSHSPIVAKKTNFLIPTLTAFEQDGIYINFEGKAQKAYKSIANGNKNIVNLDFFFLLYKKIKFLKNSPHSAFYFYIEMCTHRKQINNFLFSNSFLYFDSLNFFIKYPIKPSFEDFYQTNSFTKNSLNMLKRSKEIRTNAINFFKKN